MRRLLLFSAAAIAVFQFVNSASAANKITYLPSFEFETEYTDNLFLSPDVATAEDDLIFIFSPGLKLSLEQRSRGVSFYYRPGYSVYTQDSDSNNLRHDLQIDARNQFSKEARLDFAFRFLRTEDPFPQLTARPAADVDQDQAVENQTDFTLRRGRRPYNRYLAHIGYDHQFGSQHRLGAAYRYSFLDNEDGSIEDSQEHRPSVALTLGLAPRILMDLEMEYKQYQYTENRDDIDGYDATVALTRQVDRHFDLFLGYHHLQTNFSGETEGYSVSNPYLGGRYDLSRDTRLNIELGYLIQQRDLSDDQSRWVVNGDLTKNWRFRRSTAMLAARSGYQENYANAENLGLTLFFQLDGRADYDLSTQWSVFAEGFYRYDDYIDTLDDRQDNLGSAGAGIAFQSLSYRWLNAELGYRYRVLDSSLPINDYRENSVLLKITLVPLQDIPIK